MFLNLKNILDDLKRIKIRTEKQNILLLFYYDLESQFFTAANSILVSAADKDVIIFGVFPKSTTRPDKHGRVVFVPCKK